jgi:hypothetical protein
VSTRHSIVEASVLRVMQPLVRLLLRHGVTYAAFAAALKTVFLDAAAAELRGKEMAATDSALSLLSGVHRRDVRNLTRAPQAAVRSQKADRAPLSLAGEVVARWLADAHYQDRRHRPRALTRAEFDALVAGISSDVRPRAMLEELLRLGAVNADGDSVELSAGGFAPHQGFGEMADLLAANLGDHAAAAVANLQDERNFLEQALYVDDISADAAKALQVAAIKAWRQALPPVLAQAQQASDAAAGAVNAEPKHRARFGVYFYSTEGD